MLTFCFPKVYLGHAESSTLVITGLSIDDRGEWVPNCDDGMLVLRLRMVFDTVEDFLEFYKRYAIYVGFSIGNSPTGKNKAGKFEIIKFHEGHVQPRCTASQKQFLTSNRNVSSVHKDMVRKCVLANVGPSKVYHLLKEQVGGGENNGCMQKHL